MKLKELVFEVGINDVLGAYYDIVAFSGSDINEEVFINNLLELMETSFPAEEQEKGCVYFDLHSRENEVNGEVIYQYVPLHSEVGVMESYSIAGIPHKDLLNMEVHLPPKLTPEEALALIIFEAVV